MRSTLTLKALPALTLVLCLSACKERVAAPPPDAPALQPVASVQELMQSLVAPSADALWESVSTTVTAAGTEEKRPQSDAEWLELRHHALRIAEGAFLLTTPGRPVAHTGKTLEDAHVAGILNAEQIQARIDADKAAFATHALALQASAQAVLVAIDQRNLDRFLEAGARLDQACESCHLRYWYPDDKRPKELSAGR